MQGESSISITLQRVLGSARSRRRPRGHAEIKLDVAVGVQHQHGDAIAGLDAEVLQCAGEPGNPVAELAPCPAPISEYGGEAAAIDLKQSSQSMGNVDDAPFLSRALLPFASTTMSRDRYGAFGSFSYKGCTR